jgi:hypothetical protein
MNFDEFLRKASLYHKVLLDESVNVCGPRSKDQVVHQACKNCKEDRTFKLVHHETLYQFDDAIREPRGSSTAILRSSLHSYAYDCLYCSQFRLFFLVGLDQHQTTAWKAGQHPAWSIEVSKQFEAMLRDHKETYKKGLICESQGYGIGAFAYYRRIVELVIGDLLESIDDLMDGAEKEAYKEALVSTKNSRDAKTKIDLVKHLLPSSLMQGEHNPLGVLYRILSEGIHAMSDEECLEYAVAIRETLVSLVDQIAVSKKSRTLSGSIKKLLKKSPKHE